MHVQTLLSCLSSDAFLALSSFIIVDSFCPSLDANCPTLKHNVCSSTSKLILKNHHFFSRICRTPADLQSKLNGHCSAIIITIIVIHYVFFSDQKTVRQEIFHSKFRERETKVKSGNATTRKWLLNQNYDWNTWKALNRMGLSRN